jgi:hypothetical protein
MGEGGRLVFGGLSEKSNKDRRKIGDCPYF